MIGRHLSSAIRTTARAPASSLFIVVVLAVSIGACTAIFALIDAALLEPLPYPQPHRLVAFTYTFEGRVVPRASEAKFAVWRGATRTVEEPTAVGFRSIELETADGLRRLHAGAVSAAFFRLFGTPFVTGRPFTDDEDGQDGAAVVVLSHHLWQQQFGEDPAILGRGVILDGQARTVIGVVSRSFDTSLLGGRPDLWVPLQLNPATLEHPPFLSAYGRLQPGVSLVEAHEEDRRAAEEFRRRYPGVMGASDSFAVKPFSEVVLEDLRKPLGLLAGAVALLLALGCTNVAGLLLSQMSSRRREMAVRLAVGGSRRQIATHLLAECVLLTSVAVGLGLTLGLTGARALVALTPGTIPRLPDGAASLELDARLGVFVLLLSLVLTVVCMVLPMLTWLSMPLANTLRGNGAAAHADDRRTNRARAVIVASQVAMAALLTVGAVLLGRTWWELRTADRGFNPHNVATMRASLGRRGEQLRPERVGDIVDAAVERLAAVPGVVGAAATCCLPFESDWLTSMQVVGSPLAEVEDPLSERRVSPSYFDVLGIRLVRGRVFRSQDVSSGPGVVIVNQTMARRYFSGRDPLGAQVRLFPGRAPDDQTVVRTIVGVVADVRDGLAMSERPRSTAYVPLAQVADAQQQSSVAWIIRHRGASQYDQAAAERALRSVTGGRPVFDIGSLEAVRTSVTADTTFRATLLALFSGAALLLMVTSVYGAASVAVRQRWHELGVRLAVGASPARLRRRVLRDVLHVVSIGTATGLLGAFWGSRAVGAFLFGVSPSDPAVFAGVALLLTLLALFAAWVPASRVFHLDVADLMRGD